MKMPRHVVKTQLDIFEKARENVDFNLHAATATSSLNLKIIIFCFLLCKISMIARSLLPNDKLSRNLNSDFTLYVLTYQP